MFGLLKKAYSTPRDNAQQVTYDLPPSAEQFKAGIKADESFVVSLLCRGSVPPQLGWYKTSSEIDEEIDQLIARR